MPKNNFTFDAADLIPDEYRIDDFAGTGNAVTFREFSKTNLENYITEVQEKSFLQTDEHGEIVKDEDGNPKRVEFSKVSRESYDMLMKHFAVAANEDFADEEFFRSLDLSPKAVGRLVDLLHQLNHLDEIMMSGGNYSMLPMVKKWAEQSDLQTQNSEA